MTTIKNLELEEYLKTASSLENGLYTLSLAIENLSSQYREVTLDLDKKGKKAKEMVTSTATFLSILITIIITYTTCVYTGWFAVVIFPILGCIIYEIILGITNIIMKKLRKSTLGKITRYNNCLKLQIEELEKSRVSVQSTLNAVYALDVIFPKYRSIIPVNMFLEYIQSGRCESLNGANGAYNRYENELHINLIIGEIKNVGSIVQNATQYINQQLNSISRDLQKIKDYQHTVYQSILESNRVAAEIVTSAQAIAKSNATIVANSAWTAYSTKLIAQNTKAIAYCIEFEHKQKNIFLP